MEWVKSVGNWKENCMFSVFILVNWFIYRYTEWDVNRIGNVYSKKKQKVISIWRCKHRASYCNVYVSRPKLTMEWTPPEIRKRGRPRKTWIEGVQAAMATRNLEPDQWRNREEWSLVSGRWRQLLWNRIDRKFNQKFKLILHYTSGQT